MFQNYLKLLKTLQNIYKTTPFSPINNPHDVSIKLLLDLQTKAHPILSTNPYLSKLSQLLRNIKTLLEKLEKYQGYGLKSLLCRQITKYKISQVAYAIEAEIQAYFDRKSVQNLVKILEESENEEEKVKVLIEFIKRRVRELAALAIEALASFNRKCVCGACVNGINNSKLDINGV
ncbi:hypothetical protein Pint_12438 [Pistacia integerrima]|uniref:Uncharacterized protein n=1 Tax=Pistacia integerrima TaxID=434235 RepID=A0ACC0Y7K0_9ROSI|nr:hypothetical protein Pint_12438 [Pistacia integerrima]